MKNMKNIQYIVKTEVVIYNTNTQETRTLTKEGKLLQRDFKELLKENEKIINLKLHKEKLKVNHYYMTLAYIPDYDTLQIHIKKYPNKLGFREVKKIDNECIKVQVKELTEQEYKKEFGFIE